MAKTGAAAKAGGGFLKKLLGDLIRPVRKWSGKASDGLRRQADGLFSRGGPKGKPWATQDPRFTYRADGQLHRTQANIDAAIDKYGIQLNRGAKVRPSSRMRGAYGETNPVRGGSDVEIFPDAFVNEEQLARTIHHENVHVDQLNRNGGVKPSNLQDRLRWEDEAYDAEESWWKNHPKNPANQRNT